MKKNCLLVFLLSILFGSISTQESYAQESSKPRRQFEMPYQRESRLDLITDANFDLVRSSANPAAATLGMRKDAAPFLEFRYTHLFSRRIGWYAGVRLKFYKLYGESSSKLDDILVALAEALFTPLVTRMHVAYDAGMVYRLESSRWKCYPRLGVGMSSYGSHGDTSREIGKDIQKQHTNGETFCLNCGVSTHYMILPRTSLVLEIAYQQPLTKAKASYLHIKDEEVIADYQFRSSTYGRELNISGGISVTF